MRCDRCDTEFELNVKHMEDLDLMDSLCDDCIIEIEKAIADEELTNKHGLEEEDVRNNDSK